MFLKVDKSENEFNMKARLKVAKPNPLHEKTNTLLYLLRLLQDFFNKSFGVIIGSDMINTVLFSDVSQYLRSTNDTIFKVFFWDYAAEYFALNDPSSGKRNLFLIFFLKETYFPCLLKIP